MKLNIDVVVVEKKCLINNASQQLKPYNVETYILSRRDIKKLFKEIKSKYYSVGIIGVACIPELFNGMRLSLSLDIPTIGIPLDGNKCARWYGKAFETSFNLEHLISLLK